jgi:hypothetical protein
METGYLQIALFRAIFSCSEYKNAVEAATGDQTLSVGLGPPTPMLLLRATSAGGRLQAGVLPCELMIAAVYEVLATGAAFEEKTLIHASLANLNRLRAGLAGQDFPSHILFPFTNIRLDAQTTVRTPWGNLHPAHRVLGDFFSDRVRDVSAILCMPIQTSLVAIDAPAPPPLENVPNYTRPARIVSYSVTLGSDPTNPSSALPLGWGALSPLGIEGWGGEFRVPGLTTRDAVLSESEVIEVERWCQLLDESGLEHVQVGLDRMVSAVAERISPADALMDAVITWENLVEHNSNPTRSVLTGVSELLSGAPTRLSRTHVKTLYGTRSAVVHGDVLVNESVVAASRDAVSIAISCVRSLFERHPALIDMTSEDRSIALGFSPAARRCPHCGKSLG